MIHSSISKPLVVSSVLTGGVDGNLTKGQLAVVKDVGQRGGLKVVDSFEGMNKKSRLQIKVGEITTPANLRTKEVKASSTGWFKIEDVIEISAHVPSQTKLTVDHLEVGYDGINANTALFIPEGKSATLDIALYGEVASMFFGREEYVIQKEVYRPEGATMQEVIQKIVKELQEERVPSATGWASVTDQLSQFLEIGVIDSTNTSLTGTDYTFSTVQIKDAGESNDLAAVQAQYPTYKVEKADRVDGVTTYRILHPATVTLSDVSLVEYKAKDKGCENCPAGYDLIEGGVVYHVTIANDGANNTSVVQGLPGAVAGSAVKLGDSPEGVASYSVVLDAKLTDAQIDTFVASQAYLAGATLTYQGTLQDLCFDSVTTTYAWVAEKTCTASVKQFNIILPDTECGASRLTELQTYYPNLVIEEGIATGVATQTATLTGSSGNAVIIVDGKTYTTPYNTSLTQTATDFRTSHAAAILADTGVTVTSSGAVITFTGTGEGFPTITAGAGGLTETISALNYVNNAAAGGCKRTYSTYTITNLVCEDCDEIFLQPYYADAPESFDTIAWTEVETTYDPDAKMGIFVKGKPFYMYPETYEEDFVPYFETSLKVKSMTFGAKGSLLLNFDGDAYDPETEFAQSRKLAYAQDVNNNAVALFGAERMGQKHYTNKDIHVKNLFARTNLSQERILKYHKKYVQFAVKLRDTGLSQGGAGRSEITHEVRFIIEYGRHNALQNILNKLAAKAGVETVNIL